MTRPVRRFLARGLVLALTLLAVTDGAIRAEDREERTFAIFVKGKEAGQSRMTLVQQDDGSTYVNASADVKVKLLLGQFTYAVKCEEWWKDGKLVGLKAEATENGKKTEVAVRPDGAQLQLTVNVNGQARPLRPDVWTTSYWKLADAKYHNKPVPLLDIDTGMEYTGQLKYIGIKSLKVGAQPQDCFHFQVTGGPTAIELWFDRYHRLVRQEFTDSGHPTIVQLIAIRR
jgi:Domain of unknown function (DUF6134)